MRLFDSIHLIAKDIHLVLLLLLMLHVKFGAKCSNKSVQANRLAQDYGVVKGAIP